MAGFVNDANLKEIVYCDNVDFSGAAAPSAQVTTDGQLLIGSSTDPRIRVGTLGSSDSSITWTVGHGTITGQVTGGSTVAKTITGNTGGALPPSAGNWNIVTANSTVVFAGSGSTLTQDFNLTNLGLGSAFPSLTTGNLNAAFGLNTLKAVTSGQSNTAIGASACFTLTTGTNNTALGAAALQLAVSAGNNVAVGVNALANFIGTGTTSNVAIGVNSLDGASFAGTLNIAMGFGAGQNYTSTETSNIVIGNTGTTAESNTIRLGTQGSGSGQQNKCFVAGIAGVTVANQNFVTINTSTGQLGAASAINPFTWTDATGATQALVAQNGYITDRSGGVTYTLPASGTLGDTIKIVGKLGIAVITPNANQQILIGSTSGTVGVTGTATSNNVGDCIELICITAGASTVWRADAVIGTWTLA